MVRTMADRPAPPDPSLTGASPSGPSPVDRRARSAVAALFFTNGAIPANLLPRYPEIKDALQLGNTAYGLAVTAMPIGAIVFGPAAAWMIRRFGSGRVAVAGTIAAAACIVAAGVSGSVAILVAALFLAGGMDALTDVAQNSHGLRVERRYRRSIINSFHAVWSVGAVTGGLMAAGAIASGLSLGAHLVVSGVVFSAVALACLRLCLPGRDDDGRDAPETREPGTGQEAASSRVGPRAVIVLVALVLIAISGTMVEDAGNSWATLYLSSSLGAPHAVAAGGFIALVGAQFIGRMLGDRMSDRFGRRTVARAGGGVCAVGMGLALAIPSVAGTIAGFACAGFGVATLVPAAMSQADRLPGLRPGTGLTLVSWLMRIGFLASPPLVGMVADAVGLRFGLLTIVAAGVLTLICSSALPGRERG